MMCTRLEQDDEKSVKLMQLRQPGDCGGPEIFFNFFHAFLGQMTAAYIFAHA